MSTRHLRKLAEKLQMNDVKEPIEEVDDDFEPLYAKKLTSSYAGLVLSSTSSQSEAEQSASEDGYETPPAPATSAGKRNKNNKKNKKKRNKKSPNIKDFVGTGPSFAELDEVERSVREVNELLGEPEPAPPQPVKTKHIDLLKIESKHLDLNHELHRLFGPDVDGDRPARKSRSHRPARRLIGFTKDSYSFSVRGLRMCLIEVKDGVKYFKFTHSAEYQRNMHMLLRALKPHYDNNMREEPEVFPSNTVEALLENLNLYFQLDEASTAMHALEQVIYFMQSISEQTFNYIDGKTRLEYKHVENRAFHVALLKYLHVLTNKACHRTALEVAKLMLNLDPSDPLGVIFMIDTLAIRAREHRWLLDVYENWNEDRDVSHLFHMRYSLALAMWHLAQASKNPDDMKAAEALIKLALVKFPNVACMIMSLSKSTNQEVMTHQMFTTLAHFSTSADLMSLQFLYAKFIWPRWREPGIMEWVIANALEIIARYKDDPEMKNNVIQVAKARTRLFRKNPLQIKRHLNSIRSMSDLLADGDVPQVERSLSFNPYPSEGECVDVNRYYKDWGVKYPENEPERGVIRSFISSLIPEVPNTHGGCCDRHDIIRLRPGEPMRNVTIEEAMFREEVPDDMYYPWMLRLDNGYSQRRREHQRRLEKSFANIVRRSPNCSDAVSYQRRVYARKARDTKRNNIRPQAALIRRRF